MNDTKIVGNAGTAFSTTVPSEYKVAILGAGQIGQAMNTLIKRSSRTRDNGNPETSFRSNARLYDQKHNNGEGNWTPADLSDQNTLRNIINDADVIINALPFTASKMVIDEVTYCNAGKIYLDFTEDLELGQHAHALSKTDETWNDIYKRDPAITSFTLIPHCGLAPGAVSVIATALMRPFDRVDDVKIRVGALPKSSSNCLQYYRAWSTDGLINEYIHHGQAIRNGKLILTEPLGDLESIRIDGVEFEAFNTAGGSGTLLTSLLSDRCKNIGEFINVNYKTIRFPGHQDSMKFLLLELKFPPKYVVEVLNKNIPRTQQDMVKILVEVSGIMNGEYQIKSYSNTIYGENGSVSGTGLTAIQLSTAGSALAVLQSVLTRKSNGEILPNFITNESIPITTLEQYSAWSPFRD